MPAGAPTTPPDLLFVLGSLLLLLLHRLCHAAPKEEPSVLSPASLFSKLLAPHVDVTTSPAVKAATAAPSAKSAKDLGSRDHFARHTMALLTGTGFLKINERGTHTSEEENSQAR